MESTRAMTRERGAHAESKNCEILLFPTADRRFETKVKCPTGRASFWVKFPTVQSLTRVKCPGFARGEGGMGGLGIDWRIMNNGYASDFFQLYRGVRQGCPLSGLLFVLAIEVVAQVIRENENICGLTINESELKLSMYADDLTAFIKDAECSASHLFNLLHDFGICSGLKINISKTEGMWLGSLKCNFGKHAPFNIAWPEEYVFALGVAFAYDSTTSYKINFEDKLVTLKNVLNQWAARNLTLIGRICIVKTLAISKLVYNTSVFTLPPNFAKKVNDICFKFIWNFKPDKVKCQTIILPVDKGDLNMVDFTILDKSLKAAWVKRLQEADGSKWCSVFSSVISQYGGRFIFECNFDTQDLNLTTHVPRF